jgi:hypothetical protein
MHAALGGLTFLIGATPALLLIGGPIVPAFAGIVASIVLVLVAKALDENETAFLRSLVPAIGIIVLVPAAWLFAQTLPIPNPAWVHPVWQSAASALGVPLIGSISVDRGATLVALSKQLLAAAILFVAAAISIDRRRARWVLIALTGATSMVAIIFVAQSIAGITFFDGLGRSAAHDVSADIAALGTIIAAASAFIAFTRQQRVGTLASLAALATCAIALIVSETNYRLVAAASGLATLISIVAMRRFYMSPWGGAVIAVAIIVIAISMVATKPWPVMLDPTLAFAPEGAPVSITQRMLSDVTWTGSGAGTFGILVPIYRGIDDAIDSAAPTTASAIAVELGYPALFVVAGIAAFAVSVLLRGALLRGRDELYPAVGASCIITATLLAFGSLGTLSMVTSIVLAAAVGLGLAQSKSRTAH